MEYARKVWLRMERCRPRVPRDKPPLKVH
jgi:hypothetical protein